MSGVTPVPGSGVTLWQAGTTLLATSTATATPTTTSTPTATATSTTGYGTGAIKLGTATSAANGSFTIALASCPAASAQIYLTAQGGNAGGGSNSSLMMMAALGPCGSISLSTPVIVNEVTTAGSVYALSQFLSTTSSGTVGAPSTNATGQANAFANAANLVSVASGAALSTTPGGASTAPQENLNSIANALGACVQTSGPSSADCTELSDCALPGAAFSSGACTGGVGSVADTLAATLSIARNPALVSVAGVYEVATKAALFSPALASAPNDWSMPLRFSGNGNFFFPEGVAIDRSGKVWVTNLGGDTVTALNNDGTLDGNFAPSGSNFDEPNGVAIDSSNHVWVTNPAGGPGDAGTVTALFGNGTLDGNFAFAPPSGSSVNEPFGVAIASTGVWMANQGNNTVTELSSLGFIPHNFAPKGSNFDGPFGVAIDSSGHVWVTDSSGNTVTALNDDGTLFGNFAPTGLTFDEPEFPVIDSSGNLWVTNSRGSTVTELVGVAAPVLTPMVACLQKTPPATVCLP